MESFILKAKKHLFNGSIYQEGDIYVAKDSKDKFITYSKTIDDTKRDVFAFLSKLFNNTPFIVEYKTRTGYFDFAAYKKGRG
jgi:hypothetical protein